MELVIQKLFLSLKSLQCSHYLLYNFAAVYKLHYETALFYSLKFDF